MKKKIFVMGKVYDLGTLSVDMIENAVQADLDKVFNVGGVRFKLREVSGKTLELTFFRKYRENCSTFHCILLAEIERAKRTARTRSEDFSGNLACSLFFLHRNAGEVENPLCFGILRSGRSVRAL